MPPSHVFGFDPYNEILTRGQRLCTEPRVPTVHYDTIVHAVITETHDNIECTKCGEKFIEQHA